jgi:GT2 family glycosyltransferase
VLGDILDHLGLQGRRRSGPPSSSPAPAPLPRELSLQPLSRRPLKLPEETVERVLGRPIPAVAPRPGAASASVVIPVLDNLACTRMALESVLANTLVPYEIIVVDNGSSDETRQYLEVLALRNRHVRVLRNDRNRGFAAACNQGLDAAAGKLLLLLNNDTIVPPGWLAGLIGHLQDPAIGLVGPTTNRCGGAAEIHTSYETYTEMLDFAGERTGGVAGKGLTDVAVAEMFCAAMRREVFEAVGGFDERFEIGLFEDDDYVRRIRDAGYRVVCAEDVFVHHFGEASLGLLAADGRYGELFHANRRRFEEKWGVAWEPDGRRRDPEYEALTRRVAATVRRELPRGSTVLVVSKGDDELVELEGQEAWHFPRLDDGTYSGHHPADDEEAIAELERLRELGAEYLVLPATSLWWLDHYQGLRRHLDGYRRTTDDPATAIIYQLEPTVQAPAQMRDSA